MGRLDPRLRAGLALLEALAGDAVDAGLGRGGDDLMAALAQNGDGLRADQAGAADDDDLHVMSPEFGPATCWTFVIGSAGAERTWRHGMNQPWLTTSERLTSPCYAVT